MTRFQRLFSIIMSGAVYSFEFWWAVSFILNHEFKINNVLLTYRESLVILLRSICYLFFWLLGGSFASRFHIAIITWLILVFLVKPLYDYALHIRVLLEQIAVFVRSFLFIHPGPVCCRNFLDRSFHFLAINRAGLWIWMRYIFWIVLKLFSFNHYEAWLFLAAQAKFWYKKFFLKLLH